MEAVEVKFQTMQMEKFSISSPSQHGIGIAGFLTGTSAQEYGTDKLISNLIATGGGNLPNTIKTIDITNNGEIEISGKAVGNLCR